MAYNIIDMDIIETNKLTKYYRSGRVLGVKDLNLKIIEGEIFGFIGPNGAGKTTTIRLLLDLIRPTSGSARVFGLDINSQTIAIRREIGYLAGEIFLPENFTGKNLIDYFSHFKKSVDQKFLQDLVRRFDIDLSKKVREYSKGNKQKLAIILAVMHRPKLLILDEPTSGLDPLNQQEFYDLIEDAKRNGQTIFLSTHILEEAQRICDRVGIIKEGKLLRIDNVDKFREENLHIVFIETKSAIPLSSLKVAGVEKVQKRDRGYEVVMKGKTGKLITKIAAYEIEDLRISEPSLEDMFMQFYK